MNRLLIAAALGCALLLATAQVSSGQEFSIDAFSIEALSATSSGGDFVLTGTVGEPESDLMAGGEFSLKGGFWAVITAVQTPGSPRLTVELTQAGNIRIAWPDEYEGYRLLQNFTLLPGSWIAVTNEPVAVQGQFEVLIVPTEGQHFFRLQKEQ